MYFFKRKAFITIFEDVKEYVPGNKENIMNCQLHKKPDLGK